MKILLINDYKEKIGGAEVYMYELLQHLQEGGHEVQLFTSNITQQEYSYRIKHISLIDYIHRLFNYSAYKKVKELVKSFSPDVVHVHGIFNELSPSVIFALADYPVIMTVHNNQLLSPLPVSIGKDGQACKDEVCPGCLNCVGWKGTCYEFIKRNWYKFLLRPVKLYICPSNYMCEQLKKKRITNSQKLENGITLLQYTPVSHFSTLLFIGQLIREKGCHIAIKALALVIKKMPDIELLIAGEGSEIKNLKKLAASLGLEKNIKFLGKVPRNNLNQLYSQATVTIVPSIVPDNFPTVCLESLSAGRAVIGSQTGGIPEIIEEGKTGLLVQPDNHIELSQSIMKLVSNKETINHMSLHAKNIAPHYSLENHLDKLVNLYKSLTNIK